MEGNTHNFEYNAAYNNQSDLEALSSALDNDGADQFFAMEPAEQSDFVVGLQYIKQEVMSPECNTTTDSSEYSTPCSSVVKRVYSDDCSVTLLAEQSGSTVAGDETPEASSGTAISVDIVDTLNYAMKSMRMSTVKRLNTPLRKSVKFDGLPLIMPREKEHQMETRLDSEINTPKIKLRTRSVTRFSEAQSKAETSNIDTAPSSPETVTAMPDPVTEQLETETDHSVSVRLPQLNNIRIKHFDCDDRKRKASPLAVVQPVKYISLAESLVRFQKDTPDRFHTMPRAGDFFKPKPGRPSGRCTVPQSPAFQAKLRARPVYHPTREQIEEEELKEIRSCKVKAYPLNLKVFQEPKLGNRVERRPVTAIEPFKLTEVKKKALPDKPMFNFIARPVPKRILDGPTGLKDKQPAKLTNPVTPMFVRRHGTPKRTAPVIDQKNSGKVLGKQVIYHFGVPSSMKKRTLTPMQQKRSTDVVPFSFEERDKLAQQKKEEKIKQLFDTEKKAREFHANPLPRSLKSSVVSLDENNDVQSNLLSDGYAAKRRERIITKLLEEKEQLKLNVIFKARPATVVHAKPFVVKKAELPLQEICPFEFNTERRAKEWEEYEKVLKAKEDEMEEMKKQRQAQIELEQLEATSLRRKECVHKAKPVPRFKTLEIRPSDKVLTTPRSPFVKNNVNI